MNTANLRPDDNTEIFKQSVVVSCQNIFSVAEQALSTHPNLKKILILEHPPRFDPQSVDPVGLKPQLAKFANLTYSQLWLSSVYKDKIKIGSHKLDCSENKFSDKYINTKTNRYDGLHMYGVDGKRAYTKNLINIFKDLLQNTLETAKLTNQTTDSYHRTCPQTLYQEAHRQKVEAASSAYQTSDSYHRTCPQTLHQKAQRKTTFVHGHEPYKSHFTVPVNNRFSVLGN